MKPLSFRLVAVVSALATGAAPPSRAARADDGSPRPNIIYILLDDVRADDLGAMGHPWVQTPHIDRIAREGALFRHSFSVNPLYSPSRAAILTGQYAHTHGIIDNVDRSARSHELITFPRLLHDAGYTSAFVGKWHMGVDDTAAARLRPLVCAAGAGLLF